MTALTPAILGIEALVVLLVIPAVARGHSHVAVDVGLAVALATCLVLAATRGRRRSGRVFGSVLQPALIATGLLAWPMWILGVLFTGLWIAALRTPRPHGSAGGQPGG
jgi:MFS superfamily sulfate permease-like transporter